MEDPKRNHEEQAPDVSTDDMILIREHPLEAGEKAFAVILLVLGLIALWLSLDLWFSMNPKRGPRVSSAAAVPVFVSALWSIMALSTVIENFKMTSPLSGTKSLFGKIAAAVRYAMPSNVLVVPRASPPAKR